MGASLCICQSTLWWWRRILYYPLSELINIWKSLHNWLKLNVCTICTIENIFCAFRLSRWNLSIYTDQHMRAKSYSVYFINACWGNYQNLFKNFNNALKKTRPPFAEENFHRNQRFKIFCLTIYRSVLEWIPMEQSQLQRMTSLRVIEIIPSRDSKNIVPISYFSLPKLLNSLLQPNCWKILT